MEGGNLGFRTLMVQFDFLIIFMFNLRCIIFALQRNFQ